MALRVDYLTGAYDRARFFRGDLLEQLDLLKNEPAFTGRLVVYPDAHFEGWGIPTGLLFVTTKQDALLLPAFLRDPGCGFLVFQVTFFGARPSNWQTELGDRLDAMIRKGQESLPPCHPTAHPVRDRPPVGSVFFSSEEVASSAKFHSALAKQGVWQMSEDETCAVWRNLGAVTNGIELRTYEPCAVPVAHGFNGSEGMIGFVHSGNTLFPKLLEDRFAYRCAEFALDHRLFSLDAVEKGIFGVPLSSPIGEEYAHSLRTAARVASFNRSLVFESIKQCFEQTLPCRVSELSNIPHCGIADGRYGDFRLYRGVQPMVGPKRNGKRRWPLTFVAGHRETAAALVLPGRRSKSFCDMVSHGTSWIDHDGVWQTNRWSLSPRTSRRRAASAYYNTKPDFLKIVPYTLNLLDALTLFESLGIAETVALCHPLINIQGEDVIRAPGARP